MYSFSEAMARLKSDKRTLGGQFLKFARKNGGAIAVHDHLREINRKTLAAAAVAMIDVLDIKDEQNIGILLPPGVGGTMVNLAVALAGKTSVNLNHTAGDAQVERMCELAGIKTIITAQAYLDKIGEVKLPGRVLLADKDVKEKVSKLKVVLNMIKLRLGLIGGMDKASNDTIATILFSSGTTGDPKGVQLTHGQMLANIDGALVGLGLENHAEGHCVLTALPLFHSFGLTMGTWCGLAGGIKIAAYPNPREPQGIGKHCKAAGATYMLSTPTFCRTYMKKIPPEHLETLEFAVVGAEKCPKELMESFKAKYDVELLEGYGCTELAPTASVNIPTKYKPEGMTISSKVGSVGRPLPGIEVLLVDPESHEILPEGAEEGLIVVRSPARMVGYLNRDDLTEKAFIHDGYNTGDIGKIDEDGFLYITGRQARFAKIGGEMVPLDKVEEIMQDYLTKHHGEDYQIAVAAVSDAAKGEKLVALHQGDLPCDVTDLLDSLKDMPAIFTPKKREFYKVEEIPVLGTGKRNLKEVKALAEQVTSAVTS